MTLTRKLRDAGLGLAGIAAAVGIGALAIPTIRYPQGGSSDRTDQVASVVPATSSQPQQVSATLSWSPPQSLLLPSVSGTVTSVSAAAGRAAHCGDTLVAIDGAPVIGWCSPFPLWRSLDEHSAGPDAQAAAGTLRQLGYGTSDVTLDAEAIIAFQQRSGLEPNGTLDPSTLLWIGESKDVTLDAVAVTVGQAVTGQSEFGRVDAHLQRATVAMGDATPTRVFRPLGSTRDFAISQDGSLADLADLEAVARSTIAPTDTEPTVLPGRLPKKLRGELQRSMAYEVRPVEPSLYLGTSLAGHPAWLQFGTARMAPRPWLTLIWARVRQQVRTLLGGGR